jgi:hypothetical protein
MEAGQGGSTESLSMKVRTFPRFLWRPKYYIKILFLCSQCTPPITTAIMLGAALLCCALVLAEALQDHSRFSLGAYAQSSSATDYKVTCQNIAKRISPASEVFYPSEL